MLIREAKETVPLKSQIATLQAQLDETECTLGDEEAGALESLDLIKLREAERDEARAEVDRLKALLNPKTEPANVSDRRPA